MNAILSFMEVNSRRYTNMLHHTFNPHNIQEIKEWRYDLQTQELMRVGVISRESCDYHEHGSYLLIAYLKNAATELAKRMSVLEVEKEMDQAIGKLIK